MRAKANRQEAVGPTRPHWQLHVSGADALPALAAT